MRAKAVRLHGANDLRLDTFDLPEIRDDEILAEVVSDSLCMSTYKCATLGAAHKRVHDDVAEHPAMMGHEFAGNIVQVGRAHRRRFAPGMKFTLQPALNYKGTMWSPGYSYEFFGGDTTYTIIPPEVMELDALLEYTGEAYYEASLAEPMSCSIGAFHAAYHTQMGVYHHEMGIREGGKMCILGGGGPMGLGAIAYALNGDRRPGLLVMTDIDQARIDRANALFPVADAKARGVRTAFVNTGNLPDPVAALRALSDGGFDDVLVYAPVPALAEMGGAILARDGCLNMFAGSTDSQFSAKVNYYDVHYNATHVMGTTGGNTQDMIESLALTAAGRVNPAVMVTHVGGLDAAAEATLRLPFLPGGKKLIYTHCRMPLTAIDDFERAGETDPRFRELHALCAARGMLWNVEAERFVMERFRADDA